MSTQDLAPPPRPGKRHKTEAERFWPKVDVRGVCWEWTGALGNGYGKFGRDPEHGYRTTWAHRWAWEFLVGPIPDGLVLDHLCRNRACVNPDHLELTTIGENVRRGRNANREKTHCPAGHPLVPSNLVTNRSGGRKCRICNADAARAWRNTRDTKTREEASAS